MAAAQPSALPLDALMARLAATPRRQAAFTEDKQLAALTTGLHSAGTLAYVAPDRLVKDTTSPAPERLVVEGSRLTITAGNEPPRVMDLAGQPAALALIDTIRGALSGNLALLRRSYDVAGTGTLDAWTLVLTPRDPAVAQFVRQVRITGRRDIEAIETTQPDGDTDRLTILP